MTWEETIKYIRLRKEYADLVKHAYLDEDLILNLERFKASEEYDETLKTFRIYNESAKKILDVGSGNGISCVAFALDGYEVSAIEPDPSKTIGAGAIRQLKQHYKLNNLSVHECFMEDIDLGNELFDIVYIRQSLHHANNLNDYVSNCIRYLKTGGIFIAVREHVVYDEKDKDWFLATHPLQKLYNGENAFTEEQYVNSIQNAGAQIIKILHHYKSVINYAPCTREQHRNLAQVQENNIRNKLQKKLGFLGKLKLTEFLYKKYINYNATNAYDEANIPGRLYTFIAEKK